MDEIQNLVDVVEMPEGKKALVVGDLVFDENGYTGAAKASSEIYLNGTEVLFLTYAQSNFQNIENLLEALGNEFGDVPNPEAAMSSFHGGYISSPFEGFSLSLVDSALKKNIDSAISREGLLMYDRAREIKREELSGTIYRAVDNFLESRDNYGALFIVDHERGLIDENLARSLVELAREEHDRPVFVSYKLQDRSKFKSYEDADLVITRS